MIPFDWYPHGGNEPIGIPQGSSSRRDYGPPTFKACGYFCVYCGMDLNKDYQSWLCISVDHVVPKRVAWYNVHQDWIMDGINLVTCCRACNDFLQQDFNVREEEPRTIAQFTAIRDRTFRAKCEYVRERHAKERRWYELNVRCHSDHNNE
jgi:hypothetical protein